MPRTVILQSWSKAMDTPLLSHCTASVRRWADHIGARYCMLGDALFDYAPDALRTKFAAQPVVLTDLARIHWMLDCLASGADTVIWCDADLFVARPHDFTPLETPHSLGREIWAVPKAGAPKLYRNIHNAYMAARPGDSFLPFYRDAATRLLEAVKPPVVPQFIGPKLLTALHPIAQLCVDDRVGALSPRALYDAARGGGPYLSATLNAHTAPLCAVNIARSHLGREIDGVNNDEDAALKALSVLEAG